ncbi:monodechloroaminopyrrolnitrin synthase PrnB family protein [Actinosynnema sp. CS-041913]|uniref:monodechloroaminopyrrolnitrin synthase PrnB family protein n=1 Tax=Actinosynnema sp. CS-041913 TaxID=3239917 RepID=UPI003D93B4B3
MNPTEQFEAWLGREFVELNTELEESYRATGRGSKASGQELLRGAKLISPIEVPKTGRYELLGAVGMYLAACRRHGIGDSVTLTDAWTLAVRLGFSLGVAPRYVFAHQSVYGFRAFTSLHDEHVFVRSNTAGVVAYRRAAEALRHITNVSTPQTTVLLTEARAALDDVLRINRTLAETLDADRFLHNIRPYFKPYRVGALEYRGANAGDFAAINEIDLTLGLARADDPFYQHVLVEKYPYVTPEDQPRLRAAVTAEPLPQRFRNAPHAQANAELFRSVCRAHGAAYAFHHHRLVKPFLETPARQAPPDDVTSSGPGLDVVIATLRHLVKLRTRVPGAGE